MLSVNEFSPDRKLISSNVNSFLLTSDHLIFTTTKNLIKFVHISDISSGDGKLSSFSSTFHLLILKDLDIPPDTPEEDERCRSIEHGATIVTASPSTFKVALQMPRGNLEVICPRALVVAGIRRCIDQDDYKSAFRACRTHMVDMNILHDYNPSKFMKRVDHFLSQLKRSDFIDEFLIRLKWDHALSEFPFH